MSEIVVSVTLSFDWATNDQIVEWIQKQFQKMKKLYDMKGGEILLHEVFDLFRIPTRLCNAGMIRSEYKVGKYFPLASTGGSYKKVGKHTYDILFYVNYGESIAFRALGEKLVEGYTDAIYGGKKKDTNEESVNAVEIGAAPLHKLIKLELMDEDETLLKIVFDHPYEPLD